MKHTGRLADLKPGRGTERTHDFTAHDQGGGTKSVKPSEPRRPPLEKGKANPGRQQRTTD